jgi:hypothetical protein
VRRLVPIGLAEHEAAGVLRVLADVEREAAVLPARVVGVAVDQPGERLDGLRPELDMSTWARGPVPWRGCALIGRSWYIGRATGIATGMRS